MSYEFRTGGRCCLCNGVGPREWFVVVSLDEIVERYSEEFEAAEMPTWNTRNFHDPTLGIPEDQAMMCPPGQHLAWSLHNGCPKWELDRRWAGIHWRLDARGRETNTLYHVDKSKDLCDQLPILHP